MGKKRFFILAAVILILLCFKVNAMVGVTPGDYVIDFVPNFEGEFTFTFLLDEGIEAEVYVEGDLAQYVSLDKQKIVGSKPVTASLKLPEKIETPGAHRIFIGARQSSNSQGGLGIIGDVRGIVKVLVPYPGQYAEVSFEGTNANQGWPIDFLVTVNNLGKENLNVKVAINIEESEGKFIESLNLGEKFIETTQPAVFTSQLNTSNYKPGNYKATAVVSYGEKETEKEIIVRIGELYLGISNYTRAFEQDKINKIEIEVESFWNDPISNIFANVTILDYNLGFLTPSADISPWSKKILTGFFDTSEIKEKNFKANVTIHYQEKTTSEIIELELKDQMLFSRAVTYALIAAILALILIFAITVIVLLKRQGQKKK